MANVRIVKSRRVAPPAQPRKGEQIPLYRSASGYTTQFHGFTAGEGSFSTSITACTFDTSGTRDNRIADTNLDPDTGNGSGGTHNYIEIDLGTWTEAYVWFSYELEANGSGSLGQTSTHILYLESFGGGSTWLQRVASTDVHYYHTASIGAFYHGSAMTQVLDAWKYSGDLVRIRFANIATSTTSLWEDLTIDCTVYTIK